MAVQKSGREGLGTADTIQHMLRNAGFGGEWNVAPSAHGSTHRAFVARQGVTSLFVKLGPVHPAATLDEHLATVVRRLIVLVEHASSSAFRSPAIGAALERLRFTRSRAGEVPLVPAHTDPNPATVLVTPDRTYLVDWNGIRLSDPMRDIGLLLWWFMPQEEWPPTLRRFWLPQAASATAIDRVFWWSAVTSLRAALWIDQRAPDEGAIMSFLKDFREAEARRPNPKRVA